MIIYNLVIALAVEISFENAIIQNTAAQESTPNIKAEPSLVTNVNSVMRIHIRPIMFIMPVKNSGTANVGFIRPNYVSIKQDVMLHLLTIPGAKVYSSLIIDWLQVVLF
jgi:hypothetical protein